MTKTTKTILPQRNYASKIEAVSATHSMIKLCTKV